MRLKSLRGAYMDNERVYRG